MLVMIKTNFMKPTTLLNNIFNNKITSQNIVKSTINLVLN